MKSLIIKSIILIVMVFSFTISLCIAAEEKNAFELAISVPIELSYSYSSEAAKLQKRYIKQNISGRPNFYLILKNISTKPQSIYSQSCEGELANFSFEMITDKGSVLIEPFDKTIMECAGNRTVYLTLLPKEYFIFSAYITSKWVNFPTLKDGVKVVKLKAIYEIPPFIDPETGIPIKKLSSESGYLWQGRVESESIDVNIIPWF